MDDVNDMIDKLQSSSRDARFRAARAFVRIGPSGTASIPQLIDALTAKSGVLKWMINRRRRLIRSPEPQGAQRSGVPISFSGGETRRF
jgi:hypothetical protein